MCVFIFMCSPLELNSCLSCLFALCLLLMVIVLVLFNGPLWSDLNKDDDDDDDDNDDDNDDDDDDDTDDDLLPNKHLPAFCREGLLSGGECPRLMSLHQYIVSQKKYATMFVS